MLGFVPKKSLTSPGLELAALGMGQYIVNKSQVWYHSAIQAPLQITSIKRIFSSSELPGEQLSR